MFEFKLGLTAFEADYGSRFVRCCLGKICSHVPKKKSLHCSSKYALFTKGSKGFRFFEIYDIIHAEEGIQPWAGRWGKLPAQISPIY